MKMKKPIILIAIAIVGLLITSASSLTIAQKSSQENEIKAEYLVIKCQPMSKTNYEGNYIKPLFAGVPITGGSFDEFHPSVAGSPIGGYYAMVEESEDGYLWQPTLYGSADGVVWNPILTALYANAEFTDMDQNIYGTYGTCGASPDDNGKILILQGEIEDGWVWDWAAYDMNSFSNNRISCYTCEGPAGDPGTWNWGAVTLTGYNNYEGAGISECPYIFYQTDSEGYATIGWLTGATDGCMHTGNSIDLETKILYSVYDRDTGTGWELLGRKDNFGVWQQSGTYYRHPYITSFHVTDPTANLTYPSVAAYNNNVIVTCNKDSDVVAYYSTNGFSSKTEVLVETNASYPEVVFACKGVAILTYIKENVLYYRTSEDQGATWSDAEVFSDSQINVNYRAANLDEFSGNIYGVWEDTRGENIDAYFDMIYECENNPPTKPTFNGPKKLKVNQDYDYTFSATDPDGDEVSYLVEWGDGTSTGWITETTANHTWTTRSQFTIRCKAMDSYGLESDWTLYEVSTPRARLILRFLDYFPNAFPLLRLIFGL